jgi:hypothetical protein
VGVGGCRWVYAYHVLPNYNMARSAGGLPTGNDAAALTFSKPKNLSLPSPRRGPALSSSFSSGVASGALGSLLTGMLPVAGLNGGCCINISTCHCTRHRSTYGASLDATEERAHGCGSARCAA